LGAEKYVNVEKFQNIGLSGLADRERFKRYVGKLIGMLKPEEIEEVKKMIEAGKGIVDEVYVGDFECPRCSVKLHVIHVEGGGHRVEET
jgi:hypothetical protein